MAMGDQSLEKTTKVSRPWLSLVGYVVILAVGVSLGIFIKGVAGVWGRLVLSHKPLFFAIAPAIIQVIAGAIAGLIALWQFNRTYQQRELHHRQTREQDQQRLDDSREQFRSGQLQDQFGDIQNRLASPEPIIRANAALRLAQFGTTLAPNAHARAPRTEANNPYFVPAASQLATALYLEQRAEIRKAVREAIKNLIEFGKGDKPKDKTVAGEQPLLFALIERLADANRFAKDKFVRALAEYSVYGADSELDLTFVTSLAPFCSDAELTKTCLRALMTEAEEKGDQSKNTMESVFNVQVRTFQETRQKQQNDEIQKTIAGAIPGLLTAARQVIDTRDALAEALKEPSAPFVPAKHKEDNSDLVALLAWKILDWPKLSRCLLAGADLSMAQMPGADLSMAQLQGVDLSWAQLSVADLTKAQLQGASLNKAQLQGANLYKAQLQGANLEDTVMTGAKLQEAQLSGADLQRAYLWRANLYGVDFRLEATNEGPATTLPSETLEVANFDPRGHESAEANARTDELIHWLEILQANYRKGTGW